jgi:hypothetical protein
MMNSTQPLPGSNEILRKWKLERAAALTETGKSSFPEGFKTMGVLNNPKWERFAQELAKGITPEDAYAKAGFKAHRQNAHRLMTNDDIKARVAHRANEDTQLRVRADCSPKSHA